MLEKGYTGANQERGVSLSCSVSPTVLPTGKTVENPSFLASLQSPDVPLQGGSLRSAEGLPPEQEAPSHQGAVRLLQREDSELSIGSGLSTLKLLETRI